MWVSRFGGARARDEPTSIPSAVGACPALDPLHHLDRLGRQNRTASAAAAPSGDGDAPADRAGRMVELDARGRRLHAALAAVLMGHNPPEVGLVRGSATTRRRWGSCARYAGTVVGVERPAADARNGSEPRRAPRTSACPASHGCCDRVRLGTRRRWKTPPPLDFP